MKYYTKYHMAQTNSAVGFMSSQPKAPCIRMEDRRLDCTAVYRKRFEWLEEFISKKHGLCAAQLHFASVSYFGDWGPSDTCMLITVSGAVEQNANWSLTSE